MSRTSRPTVSVIIPLHNKADCVGRVIEGVLAQEYPNIEVIVVDDGSTDGSGAVAQRYSDRIRYVAQERRGAAAARNRGLEMARGELIAFQDADDPWVPQKLDWQVAFLEDHPEVRWCSTNYLSRSGADSALRPAVETKGSFSDPVWRIIDWFTALVNEEIAFQTSGVVMRRSLAMDVGEFDVTIPSGQDFDYWARAAELAPRCGYCLTPSYTFERNANYSITSSETERYLGKVGMISKLIDHCTRPDSPSSYAELVKKVGDRIVRRSLARGFPTAARAIIREYPDEWRAPRHTVYLLLSYIPAAILRLGARLAGYSS